MTKDTTPTPTPDTDVLKRLEARLDRLEARHEADQQTIAALSGQLAANARQNETPMEYHQKAVDAWSDRQAAIKQAADDQLEAGKFKYQVSLRCRKTDELVCGARLVGTDYDGYGGESQAISKYREFFGIVRTDNDFRVVLITGDLEEARARCFKSEHLQKKAAAQRAAQTV